jgi:hypothetical protein
VRTKGSIQIPKENLPRAGLVNVGVNSRIDEYDWFDTCRNIQLLPEQELMKAILIDAYYVSVTPVTHTPRETPAAYRTKQHEQAEARRWFRDEEDEWIFSFECVCQWLKLSPGYVRRRIMATWRKAA